MKKLAIGLACLSIFLSTGQAQAGGAARAAMDGAVSESFVGFAPAVGPRRIEAIVGMIAYSGVVSRDGGVPALEDRLALIVCPLKKSCTNRGALPVTIAPDGLGGAALRGRDSRYGTIKLRWKRAGQFSTTRSGFCDTAMRPGNLVMQQTFQFASIGSLATTGVATGTVTGTIGKLRIRLNFCGLVGRNAYASVDIRMGGVLR